MNCLFTSSNIIIIDFNNLLYRVCFGYKFIKNSSEQEIGGIYGFFYQIKNLIKKFNTKRILFVMEGKDSLEKGRRQIDPMYKIRREKMPDFIVLQSAIIRKILSLICPNCVLSVYGWEADDLIAYLTSKLTNTKIIVSGDKDLFQLFSNNTFIFSNNKLFNTPEMIFQKFGVNSYQIVDFLSLTGDISDNIPGALGIGPKTAAKLLNKFNDLNNIYQNLDLIEKRISNILIGSKQQVFIAKSLIQLKNFSGEYEINIDLLEDENTIWNPTQEVNNILKGLEINLIL